MDQDFTPYIHAAAGAARRCRFSAARPSRAEKVKIGFIFLGPVGDYGWTWAHNKARLQVEKELGDKDQTVYVENCSGRRPPRSRSSAICASRAAS